jgi:nucleoside recognition membrane protein YjiH
METGKSRNATKFLVCSAVGVFLFFVTINGRVPMVHIMGAIQGALGYGVQFWFVMFSIVAVLVFSIYCRFGSNVPALLKDTYRKDNAFSYLTYVTAAIFSIMVVFNIGPKEILDPGIGASSLEIACDSFFAIMVAGTLVAFITEFGFIEFLGKLVEPLMRLIYRLPGKASVDAIASFVIAPAAGVMITNDLYRKNVYTDREAASVSTNFSIASLGGFAFLSAIAGIGGEFTKVVGSALLCVFVMAAIMIRIPPLSRKKNRYFDGREQLDEARRPGRYSADLLKLAYQEGMAKAAETSFSVFLTQMRSSFMFGIKVNAFIMSLSTICLLVANYTSITEWIAIPMAPLLRIFGLADADSIAASSIVGILALSLPATLIKGKAIATASAFFVIVLSTCQIIFFTESANAMLESDIPLNFWDLVTLFFLRTVFLIPMVALLARLLY